MPDEYGELVLDELSQLFPVRSKARGGYAGPYPCHHDSDLEQAPAAMTLRKAEPVAVHDVDHAFLPSTGRNCSRRAR
jgi:hypothetical protein